MSLHSFTLCQKPGLETCYSFLHWGKIYLGAVQLPQPSGSQECPVCNPGMHKDAPELNCSFCPDGEFSNGTASCQKCPAKHKAVKSYIFNFWDKVPPNTDLLCYSISGIGCPESSSGWSFSNDAISTNLGNADDTIAMLQVNIPKGFHKAPQQVAGHVLPVGTVEFVFEMICPNSENCTLFFGLVSSSLPLDAFNIRLFLMKLNKLFVPNIAGPTKFTFKKGSIF